MFFTTLLFFGLFCSVPTRLCGGGYEPSSQEAEQLSVIHRLFDLSFKDNDWELLDELVADDVVIHNLGGDDQTGLHNCRKNLVAAQNAFQRLGIDIHDLFARDHRVVIVWTLHLMHVGEYLSIPATQKNIAVSGINIYCFNDEQRICEIWGSFDKLAILNQIANTPNARKSD